MKNETFATYIKELSNDKDTNYLLWKAYRSLKRPVNQSPHGQVELKKNVKYVNLSLQTS